MNTSIKKIIFSLLAVACVLLAGCNGKGNGEVSPSDSGGASQTDQPGYSDIIGTWELSDTENGLIYYLTFEDGSTKYVAYDTNTEVSVEGSGTYEVNEDGNMSISIALLGETLENTYTVSISGDTLTLALAEGETATENGYSLAGTYTKSSTPDEPSPDPQESDTETAEPTDSGEVSASPAGKDEALASFLAEASFLAGTDTFLGSIYENEVVGSFVLSDSDIIEGTFYVDIAESSNESANFYIEGDKIYFTNTAMGTYSISSFEVTDTYIKLQQIESDADGEDLLNIIDGTWHAN